jgi:hypothetical protein
MMMPAAFSSMKTSFHMECTSCSDKIREEKGGRHEACLSFRGRSMSSYVVNFSRLIFIYSSSTNLAQVSSSL